MSQDDREPSLSVSRRSFMIASGALAAAPVLTAAEARAAPSPGGATPRLPEVVGTDHWAAKTVGADKIKLFLRRKRLRNPSAGAGRHGAILFVHGSSFSATPTYDLQIPGRPECSVMDWFARRGYD